MLSVSLCQKKGKSKRPPLMMRRQDWHYPYFIDLQSLFTGVLDAKNALFRSFWISFWIGIIAINSTI